MASTFPISQSKAFTLDSGLSQDVLNFFGDLAVIDAGKDEAQAEIMGQLIRILAIERCALYLCDESTDHWFIKKVCSSDGEWVSHVVPADEVGEVIEVIRGGSRSTIQLPDGDWVYSLPLLSGGRSIGALELRSGQPDLDTDLMVTISQIFAHNLTQSTSIRRAEENIQEMQTFQGQLLNSRNTLRALFDSSPASIYIVDPHYRLIAINRTRSDLFRSPP